MLKERVAAEEAGDGSNEEYSIRVHDDLREIDARAWNDLVAAQPSATPFVALEYLQALDASKSAVAKTGWAPDRKSVV